MYLLGELWYYGYVRVGLLKMCMDGCFFEMLRLVRLISVNLPDFCYEELGFSFFELSPLDNKLFFNCLLPPNI